MTDTLTDTHHHDDHAAPPAPAGWHRWTAAGWLRVLWVTPLGFGFGMGLVVLMRWLAGWHPIFKGSTITGVELVTTPLGFLGGIGGFDYWLYYMGGRPTRPDDHSGHGARSWKDYFKVNTDHKVIGIQYTITSLLFLLFGFTLMMIMRFQMAYPGHPIPVIGSWFGAANAPGSTKLASIVMPPQKYTQ